MSSIIVILIVVATIKFFLFGGILWAVFRKDIRAWWDQPRETRTEPVCMYCGSVYTHPTDEGTLKWENEQLVLVTMLECEHCRLPFWHVERIPANGSATRPREQGKI